MKLIDRWFEGAPFLAAGTNIGVLSVLVDTGEVLTPFNCFLLVSGIGFLAFGTFRKQERS